jgi:peptidoglycan/xylan/chitin deacetylase (PgdA/CDA1 family)
MLAAGGFGLAGCAGPAQTPAGQPRATMTPASPGPSPLPSPPPSPVPPAPAPAVTKVPLPAGVITELPTTESLLAWTVDDGSDSEVIRRYAEFAESTGTRLTFFLNGSYPGWTENAALLRPLVASGQIQLANHTWSHADLTSLDDGAVIAELQRNHDFMVSTFGIDPRPYFRPPYGYRNSHVDALAASIGYTSPIMWYGSLADSESRPGQQIIELAHQWFLPAHIVIGHLNFLPVTEVFPQLHQLIEDRQLTTVTLNDMFIV